MKYNMPNIDISLKSYRSDTQPYQHIHIHIHTADRSQHSATEVVGKIFDYVRTVLYYALYCL